MSDTSGREKAAAEPLSTGGVKAGAAPRRGLRSPWLLGVVGVVAVLALVATAVVVVLYVRGGGPAPAFLHVFAPVEPDVLAASGPAETVLRTLRLAGYERAAVGEQDGAVVVRIELPEVRSSADVELTWQTAMAAASAAYPGAASVTAQLVFAGQPLLEAAASGADITAAVEADDARALARATRVTYLWELER